MSDTKPRARLALGTDLDLFFELDPEGHFVYSYTTTRAGEPEHNDAGAVQCVAVAHFARELYELLEQHDVQGLANYQQAQAREAASPTPPAEAEAATVAFEQRTGMDVEPKVP